MKTNNYTKRNKRCVWRIAAGKFKGSHYAVYPEKLIEVPMLAGCPRGGIVLDPFVGSGTTGIVAKRQSKYFIGIDLNPSYCDIAVKRIRESS